MGPSIHENARTIAARHRKINGFSRFWAFVPCNNPLMSWPAFLKRFLPNCILGEKTDRSRPLHWSRGQQMERQTDYGATWRSTGTTEEVFPRMTRIVRIRYWLFHLRLFALFAGTKWMTIDRSRRKRSAAGLGSVAVRMRNQSPAGTKFQAQGTSPHSRKLRGAVSATEHGRLLARIMGY